MKQTHCLPIFFAFCLSLVNVSTLYAQTTAIATHVPQQSSQNLPISPMEPVGIQDAGQPILRASIQKPLIVPLIKPALVTPSSTITYSLITTRLHGTTLLLPLPISQTLSLTNTAPVTGSQSLTNTQSISKTEVVTKEASIAQRLPITSGSPFDWSSSENYLLLGADQQAGQTDWRTDTIMLLGLDRTNQRAAIFSIPRDLSVNVPGDVPGAGTLRINQVDHWAEQRKPGSGPVQLSQTLYETLGVSTTHWVRIQMSGFARFVDALGGVTVPLDCPFSEPMLNRTTKRWEEFTLPAGNIQMNGETASWFIRLRLRENDFGRASRQRQFLWSLREKALNANLLTQAPSLWTTFQDSFTSNLDLVKMIELGTLSLRLKPENVRASGLSMQDLEEVVSPEGVRLLQIADAATVRAKLNRVWQAPPLSLSYRHDVGGCTTGVQVASNTLFSATVAVITTTLPLSTTATQPQSESTSDSASASTAETSLLPVPTPVANPVPSTVNPVLNSRNANPELFVGQRIRIRKGFATDVRSQPAPENGHNLGTMADGEQAVILGGPAQSTAATDVIVWWFVRTDSGLEGWAAANTESTGLFDVVR